MSGINGISGPIPSLPPQRPDGPGRAGAGEQGDFGSLVRRAVDQVDGKQQKAALAIQDLLTGRSGDVLTAVHRLADADLSFKLLIGVRNKMIEAYKQTMNMQI